MARACGWLGTCAECWEHLRGQWYDKGGRWELTYGVGGLGKGGPEGRRSRAEGSDRLGADLQVEAGQGS